VHSTTEFSPFEIVYGFNPLTSIDLIALPVNEMVSLDGNHKAWVVKTLHESVRQQIEKIEGISGEISGRLGLSAYMQGEISGP
jgi:hypothetical protein